MAYESLQALVGTAVIDVGFRHALLNGSRRSVIQSFDLTREETDAVMAIYAETLEQFASQLHRWILKQQKQVEPPALSLPTHKYAAAHEESGAPKEPARLASPLSALVT